ncbi:MAG: acyl-CoA synthetase [Kiritimatiellae bacterium]|nr:acyl-CoA synthetase [Kiritimatiellia bacterium]
MLSAVFAALFGFSLLPGRVPLCLVFARRISGGITPDGAEEYCRRLTWVWFAILICTTAIAATDWRFSFATPAIVALTFLVEGRIRRKRFSVTFHTSGSTGGPKTIVKTFESLAKETAMHRDHYLKAWGGAEKPVFLATVEESHMYGTLWRVMLPKALGCRADLETIVSPEQLVAKMKECAKVFLVTTPSFLSRFAAYASQYDVPGNAVEITTSGAMLSDHVSKAAKRIFGVEPRQIYGSTETGGIASRRGDGLWETFDPVKVSVEEGRLLVRSPFSFRKSYLMGDGVEMDSSGRRFRLLGRMDRLVKINEERVNLAEMEEKVVALGFRECALAVIEGERGPMLGAVLAGVPRSVLEMRKLLLPVFPKGTVPKRWRFVGSLPRNAQGKVVHSEIVKCLTVLN